MPPWNRTGRRLGRPAAELLGGRRRDRVRVYAHINRATRDRTSEGFAAAARAALMPDVKYCGGLFEGTRIAALAESQGLHVAPHNPSGPVSTAASLQLREDAHRRRGISAPGNA